MRLNLKKILNVFLVSILYLATNISLGQTTIRIDKKVNYQKIDGFGAFGGKNWLDAGYDKVWLDTVLRDLGVTIIRHEIDQSFEMVNDNSNPFVTDFSKFTLSGPYAIDGTKAGGCINTDCTPVNGVTYATPSGSSNINCNGQQTISNWFSFLKAIHERGLELGDTIKIIGTVWSPPAWMKYNNCRTGNDPKWNRLIASDFQSPDTEPSASWSKPAKGIANSTARPLDRKEEYAEFVATYVKVMKSVTGVNMYAIGIGNEPAFAQDFQSCVWSPKQMAKGIYTIGKRFKNDGLATKLLWSEDIGDNMRYEQYKNEVIEVDSIRPYGSITAVHAYNANGTKAESSSANMWKTMYNLSNKKGDRPFWMTETSGYGIGWWNGGRKLNDAMYVALKFGKISAWVWWSLSESKGYEQEYALIERTGNDNYILGKRYYVSKQYYRYIRPGAIGVGCDPITSVGGIDLNSDILALAFQHNSKQTLTLVITNSNAASKNINLEYANNSAPPSHYEVYQTDSTHNCEFIGTVSGMLSNYTIAGGAIVTFYGKNSIPESEIPITSLLAYGEGYKNTITSASGTLQMYAKALPLTSTQKEVTWSIAPITGTASISSTGLLRPLKKGKVRVIATSIEHPTILGIADITHEGVALSSMALYITDLNTGELIEDKVTTGSVLFVETLLTPDSSFASKRTFEILSENSNAEIDSVGIINVNEIGIFTVTATVFSYDTIKIIRELEAVTSLETSTYFNKAINKLNIFPNPASDKLNVKLQYSGANTIKIFNSLGVVFYYENSSSISKNIEINTVNIPDGFYIININGQSKAFQIRR